MHYEPPSLWSDRKRGEKREREASMCVKDTKFIKQFKHSFVHNKKEFHPGPNSLSNFSYFFVPIHFKNAKIQPPGRF